jgi:hypothetical protein
MMKVYALLIQKYNFDLQDKVIEVGMSHLELVEEIYNSHQEKMKRLFDRLQKYHNFDKKKFWALQDQAVTF